MLAALLHHLLPPTCLCCQRLLRAGRPGPLCGACHDARAPLPAGLRSVAGVEACFAYEGSLAAAVAALKFGGRGELAPGLAALLADAACLRGPIDLLVPVPLHPLRGLARGYNQAALLATCLSRHLDPRPAVACALARRRRTRPQTELAGDARRRNVAAAFAVRAPAREAIAGRRVLVIDDVTTTGATLGACLEALRACGAREPRGLALLRATP